MEPVYSAPLKVWRRGDVEGAPRKAHWAVPWQLPERLVRNAHASLCWSKRVFCTDSQMCATWHCPLRLSKNALYSQTTPYL